MLRNAEADGGEHEFTSPERQDLAADRPGYIGNIHNGDDEDRQPQAARFNHDDAEIDALRDEHDRKGNGEKIDWECPQDIENARQDCIGHTAEEAGGEPDGGCEDHRDDGRGA